MALINCPECGKENVSDSAETCPSCGYGIKAYYQAIETKKIEEEKEKKERETAKSLYAPKQPEKDKITTYFLIGFSIISIFLFPLTLQGTGIVIAIIVISASGYVYSHNKKIYDAQLEVYNNYLRDKDAYIEKKLREAKMKTNINVSTSQVRCPKCGSTQIQIVKQGWTVTTGMIGSNKNERVCINCKHKF